VSAGALADTGLVQIHFKGQRKGGYDDMIGMGKDGEGEEEGRGEEQDELYQNYFSLKSTKVITDLLGLTLL